jgi:hypothetical protein
MSRKELFYHAWSKLINYTERAPREAWSATWNLETNWAFALGSRKTTENLNLVRRSQNLPDAKWFLASRPALNTRTLTLIPICAVALEKRSHIYPSESVLCAYFRWEVNDFMAFLYPYLLKNFSNADLGYAFRPYLTGNTFHLRNKDHSVNVVWGNNRCFLWESFGTQKCTVWAECRDLIYKNSVRTSQETHVSTTKRNRLMLFRETVAVYCENHTEHRNTLCGAEWGVSGC